jgi:hypothetical protein
MDTPTNKRPAYSCRISPFSPNLLEVRDTPPEFPALCLRSILSNDEALFDVIVLEYSQTIQHSVSGISLLVTRLRERFPASTIVFVQLWYPLQYAYKPKMWSLRRWMADNGLRKIGNERFGKRLNRTRSADWTIDIDQEWQKEFTEGIVPAAKVNVWQFPQPDSAHEALLKYGAYFEEDLLYLNQNGHAFVAQQLSDFIHKLQPPRITETQVQPWRLPDQCLSWYGEARFVQIPYDNLIIRKVHFGFDKWALECNGNCSIQVTNKMNVPATVYMQYMAVSPRKVYRDYNVTMEGQTAAILKPYFEHSSYPLHIQSLTAVGRLEPSQTETVFLRPVAKSAGKPIRLTGIVVSPVGQMQQ